MASICLITPGQPSINPRLVKEADALVEAGHEVHVICSHVIGWADEADKKLLVSRGWTCSYVGGEIGSWEYAWTRLRHGLIRKLFGGSQTGTWISYRALTRVTPELLNAVETYEADLYIAHYVGALAAAVRGASKDHAAVGFDAEDLESAYYHASTGPSGIDGLIEAVERECIGKCCYVTAASPGIAAAYQTRYRITPTTILNVFSLDERPVELRRTSPSGPMRLYWFSQTIGPERGLEDAIRAMGKLKGHKIQLHLRGRVRSEYWNSLQRLMQESGVESQALVLHAPISSEEMIRAAAEFDVGLALEQPVSFNRDICLTNKIFSYLLAGNAIVGSDTSGQRPIMEQIGRAGFLYAAGDVAALAEGLWLWYNNREELHAARHEAWLWGTRRFNWDLEKKKFVEVVNKILIGQEPAKCVLRASKAGPF